MAVPWSVWVMKLGNSPMIEETTRMVGHPLEIHHIVAHTTSRLEKPGHPVADGRGSSKSVI